MVATAKSGFSSRGQTKFYLRKVIRPLQMTRGRILYIWDAFPGQVHEEVTDYVKKMGGVDCVEVPGKMTKHLQPLDLKVNNPFK